MRLTTEQGTGNRGGGLVSALLLLVAACASESPAGPVEASYVLTAAAGDGQSVLAGGVSAAPLSVMVRDAAGVPVVGARLVYRVTRGSAAMVDSIAVSGSDGVARASVRVTGVDSVDVTAAPVAASQRSVRFRLAGAPGPVLSSVSPASVGVGDTVIVRGQRLTTAGASLSVRIGDQPVLALAGATDSLVRAIVPGCLAGGATTVRVTGAAAQTGTLSITYVERQAALTLQPYQAITVSAATLGGCLTLAGGGAQYLVVPSFASVGSALDPINWRLGASTATATPLPLNEAFTRGASAPAQRFETWLRAEERRVAPAARAAALRRIAQPERSVSVAPLVGSIRRFKMVSSIDGSTFTTVDGRLRYGGEHVWLYTDTSAVGFSDAQYQALGALFDKQLYGLAVSQFGSVSDIDGDGHVSVLFTPVVNALVKAEECGQKGYVTAFFYPNDLQPTETGSNKGEVLYSFIPDSLARYSCTHTATDVMRLVQPAFIHELQHAISFNQHVLARGGPPEEIWLNEGLSHIAEEAASRMFELRYPPPSGRGTTTQIFPDSAGPFISPQLLDAYVYLASIRQHSVTSYYLSGSLEERGATWLFLRWLGAQRGEGVFRKMIETSATGIANVEAQSGEKFGSLFGDFGIALFADSLPGLPRALVPPRYRFGDRNLRQLMAREAVIAGFPLEWPLPLYSLGIDNFLQTGMYAGTMTHALLRVAPPAQTAALRFTRLDLTPFSGAEGAQVSIFRLPP